MHPAGARIVRVAAERLPRWCANFEAAHGSTAYAFIEDGLRLDAADGSSAVIRAPFGRRPGSDLSALSSDLSAPSADFSALSADLPALSAMVGMCEPPQDWGVLLVRKGGFAVARLAGGAARARKVGQRHVQGRTKAGGQSQQRFARRRDNQARSAYEAAAGHAAERLLSPPAPVVVTGGDRAAIDAVLSDPRLTRLRDAVVDDWLDVPDPRGAVLDAAIRDAHAPTIEVTNA